MKSRNAVLLTLLVIATVIVGAGLYLYGKFDKTLPMKIVEREETKIVFHDVVGRYGNALAEMNKVVQQLAKTDVKCEQLFGQYFYGKFTAPDNQRARYGCVVKRLPKEAPDGLSVGTIPAGPYAFTKRTQKGMLTSVAISIQLSEFATTMGYASGGYIAEFYDVGTTALHPADAYLAVQKIDDLK